MFLRGITVAVAVICGACGDAEPPAVSPRASSPPAPPAMPSQAAAVAAAREAGVGSCATDVPRIRVLPLKGDFGVDPAYDRIVVHGPAYTDCLLAMVSDALPISDPGEGPERRPYALGDLAYDLLARTGAIEYGTCIPPAVLHDLGGAEAVYRWLATPRNRQSAYSCLVASTGGLSSGQP